LLCYPITADIEELQLELIDMQSDHTVKGMFNDIEELQLELIDMQSDHTVKGMFNAVCDIS
jgi:hypothetical protein